MATDGKAARASAADFMFALTSYSRSNSRAAVRVEFYFLADASGSWHRFPAQQRLDRLSVDAAGPVSHRFHILYSPPSLRDSDVI